MVRLVNGAESPLAEASEDPSRPAVQTAMLWNARRWRLYDALAQQSDPLLIFIEGRSTR